MRKKNDVFDVKYLENDKGDPIYHCISDRERVQFYIIGKCEKNHMFCQLLPLHLKYVCVYVCVCACARACLFLKNVTVG